MNIKVLVIPHCSGCKIVKGYLDDMNIEYEVIDMTQHPEVLQKYPTTSAPTIVINEKVEFIGTPSREELRKEGEEEFIELMNRLESAPSMRYGGCYG